MPLEDNKLTENQKNNIDQQGQRIIEKTEDNSYSKKDLSSIKKANYKDTSGNKILWYKKKDINNKQNTDRKNIKDLFSYKFDDAILYFNPYGSGIYILSKKKKDDANYALPIKSYQRNGYLLQCYDFKYVAVINKSVNYGRC